MYLCLRFIEPSNLYQPIWICVYNSIFMNWHKKKQFRIAGNHACKKNNFRTHLTVIWRFHALMKKSMRILPNLKPKANNKCYSAKVYMFLTLIIYNIYKYLYDIKGNILRFLYFLFFIFFLFVHLSILFWLNLKKRKDFFFWISL